MNALQISFYVISIICSGTGFICQMLVSGFWSTAYSNDVTMFSLNLAFYFLAMGIGAHASKKWRNIDLTSLIEVSLMLSLWAGISVSILRWGISKFGNLIIIPIIVVFITGFLTGLVIPLIMRTGTEKVTLPYLLFFDYMAAIAFTLFFTFILLIRVGYHKCSLILCAFSLTTTIIIMIFTRKSSFLSLLLILMSFFMPHILYKSILEKRAPTMNSKGEAKLIISKQSHYQKIVFTEENISPRLKDSKQHVLYLDGFVQFSSTLEYVYHFCITNIPVAAAEFNGSIVKKALILGGGDGLAARNLVYVNSIEKIVMVELDPEMINLSYNNPYFRYYNKDSLHNPKVKVIIADAFRWVRNAKESFDLIVIDFPAPKNLTLARLFSAEFYHAVFKLLNPAGVAAIQAGPSFSLSDTNLMTISKINTSVKKTIRSLGYSAHSYVSTPDEDSFILVTRNDFDMQKFSEKVGITSPNILSNICRYSSNWKEPEVEINTLNTLILARYMLDWFKKAKGPFFNYRGRHSVFLPE